MENGGLNQFLSAHQLEDKATEGAGDGEAAQGPPSGTHIRVSHLLPRPSSAGKGKHGVGRQVRFQEGRGMRHRVAVFIWNLRGRKAGDDE